MIVFDKTCKEWEVPDITQDMFVDCRHINLPQDKLGFVTGNFRITMEWIPDENNTNEVAV